MTRYDPRDLNINSFQTKDLLRTRPSGGTVPLTTTTLAGTSATADGKAQPRAWQNLNSEVNPQVRPSFLNEHGKWDTARLPGQVVDSKAQTLTAPGVFTPAGTIQRSLAVEGPKAIGAVYSYNDVSPAVNTECTHDAASWADRTSDAWDPTVQKLRTARHHHGPDRVDGRNLTDGQAMMLTSRGAQSTLLAGNNQDPTVLSLAQSRREASAASQLAPGGDMSESVRKASVDSFWTRMKGSGGSSQLSLRDLTRCQDGLSQHAVAGGHNAHLVAGQWRHLQRPVVGSPLFTDYYGPYNKESGNYYGRSWNNV